MKKFTKILGIGLSIAVLASMLIAVAPASAGYESFSKATGLSTEIAPYTDIKDVEAAPNGTTGYAVVANWDESTGDIYKTLDGGKTWKATGFDEETYWAYDVELPPDTADGSFLVVSAYSNDSDSDCVLVSTNGGTSFAEIALPTSYDEIITVAASPLVSSARSIAIGGYYGGNPVLQIFTEGGGFGGGGGWVDAFDTDYTDPNGDNVTDVVADAVLAVRFSPSYATDYTLVVVTDLVENSLSANLFFNRAPNRRWNGGFASYYGWGDGIDLAMDGYWVDMVLPGSYNGYTTDARLVYLAIDNDMGGGALLRLANTTPTKLAEVPVGSVDVNAAGDKLVAGGVRVMDGETVKYIGNAVYRVDSPATAAAKSAVASAKSPGYEDADWTSVAFFGATVGAGTDADSSYDDSAFALSADSGKNFNDVAFVDTAITYEDGVVNADGTKYYLVTSNADNGVFSLWRKTTSWERVYKTTLMSAGEGGYYIVRPALDNFDVIYLAEVGGGTIWYSNDAGQATWQARGSWETINDMAAESASVVYVLTGGKVAKSTSGGSGWNDAVDTKAGADGSITLVSASNLLVAGATGVAYSTDSGATWTSTDLGFANAIEAVADKLTAGGVITATDGAVVKQFTIGTSTKFGDAVVTAANAQDVTGVAISGMYTYAVSANDTASTLYRSPANPGPWGSLAIADTNLCGLAGKSGGVLYSYDNTANAFYTYTEVFTVGPTLAQPADKFSVPINMETGYANNVVLQWTAVANTPKGTIYKVAVALDSAFTQTVKDFTTTNTLEIVGPTAVTTEDKDLKMSFQSDTIYYWKVWVVGFTGGTFDSPYSAARNFKIETLSPLKIISPSSGASAVSVLPTFVWTAVRDATEYQIVVSDRDKFDIITFSHNSDKPMYAVTEDEQLAYNTVYYWRVKVSKPDTAASVWVTGIFTTEQKPVPPTSPFTITQPAPTTITLEVPPQQEVIPAYLLWIIIGIGAILVIALIVLIVRTRRTG